MSTLSTEHERLSGQLAAAPAANEALAAGSVIEFQVMPAGTHTCNFTQMGRCAKRTVAVTPDAAAALQEQLNAANTARGGKQRCFFDFDHADKGPAAAWPLGFTWRDGAAPGVYCRAELSAAGAEAIRGKTYRSFSPVFSVTKGEVPARVIADPDPDLCMGSLVNEPAFHAIEPLFAKETLSAAGDSAAVTENKNKHNMSEQTQAVAASQAATDAEALKAASASNRKLQEKLEQLEAADAARRKADAEAAVAEAVKRGAIPAADEQLKAKWTKWATETPDMLEALKAMPGKESLAARETVQAAHSRMQVKEGPARIFSALGEQLKANRAIRGYDAVSTERRGAISREIQRIYAAEFKPTSEVLGMPFHAIAEALQAATASDTLGTLVGTLVTQRTLELFRINYPLFKSIYLDFSDQPASFGQTITTRIISKPAVQTYSDTLGSDGRPAGWSTASAATTTDASTSLDEHVGVPVVFSADTLAKTTRRLFDEIAPGMSYALASYFVAKIYALFTAARYNGYAAVSGTKVPVAYATYAKSAGDFARSAVVDLNAIFNPNEVPLTDRVLLLNSAYFAALGKDPSLVTFWAGQRNPELITEGELPKMSKFIPIEAPDFPATSNRVGMALQKNGVVAISRLPNDYSKVMPGASYGNVTQIADPETGMAVMLVEYINHTGGYAEMRMETMIGAGVGDKRAGLVLTSQ